MCQKQALTSSLDDAVTEIVFLDDFDPVNISPLSVLPRDGGNGFVVTRPGGYVFLAQSYCLKAGTYGPGTGDGYLYAPLKGPSADIVRSVLRRSVDHPEISQRDIQLLLWAIIARTKPSRMNSSLRATAAILLKPGELARLEAVAFEEISQGLFNRALGKLPPAARKVFEAERDLRRVLAVESLSYEDAEQIAVLSGTPPSSKNDRPVPWGRWSYHPDGYFVRYFPRGYSRTRIQVYIPEEFAIERDAKNRITKVTNEAGESIEFGYDESVEPLRIKGESRLYGYAFRSIKMRFALPRDPKVDVDLGTVDLGEWTNAGWVLSGRVKGKGRVTQGDQRYDRADARYRSVVMHKTDLNSLSERLKRLRKEKKVRKITKDEMDQLIDLAQVKVALTDLFAKRSVNTDGQLFDPVRFVQRAWASEFAKTLFVSRAVARQSYQSGFLQNSFAPYTGLSSWGRVFEKGVGFEGGGAVPGKTGRQRLGQSNRPHEPDNSCAEAYKECEDQAGTDYLRCFSNCFPPDMPDNPTQQEMRYFRECSLECQKQFRRDRKNCSTLAQGCLEK